jgi:retron-type reverse transcriptase
MSSGGRGPLGAGRERREVGFDEAISLNELCKAARRCRRGVSNKSGPVEYNVHRLSACKRLRDDLVAGRYKARPGTKVMVYRPKKRVATAPWFRDRVWQSSMLANGVYDDLTRPFIADNIACQKGKGTDMAIRHVVKMLQKLHRKAPGAPVYGVHLDIRRYFPSTPHSQIIEMDEEVITDKRFLPHLDDIVKSSKDERAPDVIAADPFGERGTGLGSPINQLHQVAMLNRLDHEVKCICNEYIRYNDDFLILSHDREAVEHARGVVREHLEGRGLEMTDKAGVFKVEHGFYFLRKRFIMSRTGKIVIRLHPKALAEERKTLKGMKRAVGAGIRTMEEVRTHYQSWIANAEYAGDAPIREMDRFYTATFREYPKYKRKRRYLYGSDSNARRKAGKGRKGKQKAESGERESKSEAGVHRGPGLSGDPGR